MSNSEAGPGRSTSSSSREAGPGRSASSSSSEAGPGRSAWRGLGCPQNDSLSPSPTRGGRTVEISMGGSGGQGLVLMGIIMAEAAGVYEGRQVAQSQLYGPESRGGASRSDVIISDEEIDYPEVEHPDVLFAFNQLSAVKFAPNLKKGGTAIFDTTFVSKPPAIDGKVYELPITRLAREQVGKEIVANIVALGAIAVLTGVVSREAVTTAVLDRVPKGTEEINQKALQVGFGAADALLGAGG